MAREVRGWVGSTAVKEDTRVNVCFISQREVYIHSFGLEQAEIMV